MKVIKKYALERLHLVPIIMNVFLVLLITRYFFTNNNIFFSLIEHPMSILIMIFVFGLLPIILACIIYYTRENSFKKKKGLKKIEITEDNVRYEILKKFNAFLEKEIRTNFNLLKNSKKNIQ